MSSEQRRLIVILLLSTLASGGYLMYTRWKQSKAAPPPTSQVQGPASTAQAPGAPMAGDQPSQKHPAQPTIGTPTAPFLSPEERAKRERIFTLRGKGIVVTASNLTATLRDVRLTNKRFVEAGHPMDLATANKELFPVFRTTVLGVDVPPDVIWTGKQLSASAVEFETRAKGFVIARKLEMGKGPYQIWSTVRVTNESTANHTVRLTNVTDHYVHLDQEGGGMFAARSPRKSDILCVHDDTTKRIHRESAEHTFHKHGFGPKVTLAAVENVYFTGGMAPEGGAEECRLSWFNSVEQVERPRFFGLLGTRTEPEGTLYRAELRYPKKDLAPGESMMHRTLGYFGPKERAALHAAGHGLPKVIDLGWFSLVAEYLVSTLAFINKYVHNWGIAIILMTILFKLVFFPLTWKSFQSLAKMRVLKPEMDRINELYGNDKEKKGVAIMELYRKHGVNPVGGCLPQLLQMPVWIAFFASLSTNTELYRATFALHWTDLSAPDSLFILPIAQGLLIFVQQRMTPQTMDPAQARMMLYFMPIMMTAIYFFMPSGLCLYSVTNSILTFAQQKLIFRRIDHKQAAAAAANEAASSEPPESDDEPGEGGARVSPILSETRIKLRNRAGKRRTKRG